MINKMLLVSGLISFVGFSHAETVKVYAAASLTNALTDIVRIYEKQHPQTDIVPVFGASSALANKLKQVQKVMYFSLPMWTG